MECTGSILRGVGGAASARRASRALWNLHKLSEQVGNLAARYFVARGIMTWRHLDTQSPPREVRVTVSVKYAQWGNMQGSDSHRPTPSAICSASHLQRTMGNDEPKTGPNGRLYTAESQSAYECPLCGLGVVSRRCDRSGHLMEGCKYIEVSASFESIIQMTTDRVSSALTQVPRSMGGRNASAG